MIELLIIVFFSPVIIAGTCLFWIIVGDFLESLIPKEPPYCDSDPLCHPKFIWKDGKGYIGNLVVIDEQT